MIIEETHVNATEGYLLGEPMTIDASETIFGEDAEPGEIYRFALREFGRCTGKVYVDSAEGKPPHVGWIFQKRERYEDCNETYLHETWVTLLDRDETIRERSFHVISPA